MSKQLEAHRFCALVPAMSEEQYQALKADIAAWGLREAIVVHEGKILDGRHRYRACMELGIDPTLRPWDGQGLATDYVLSQNLHRRHLDKSQRAAVAVQAEAMREAERKAEERQEAHGHTAPGRKKTLEEIIPQVNRAPQARDEVARQFGTNPRYVQDAKAIREEAPELLKKVATGELTLPQAKQELRRQQKRAELRSKAKQSDNRKDKRAVWRIRRGGCLSILPGLAEKARLVFADPPYNIGIDYGDGPQADRLDDTEYMAWCEQWLAACRDVLTADGSLWVLIGDEYAAEYGVLLKRLGLTIRSWIKWYESFGVNCARNFNRCSRHLFYCVRDPKRFVFHEEAVTRPSDRQTKYADRRAAPGGKLWDNVWGITPAIPRLTGTAAERIPDFPTQLPLARRPTACWPRAWTTPPSRPGWGSPSTWSGLWPATSYGSAGSSPRKNQPVAGSACIRASTRPRSAGFSGCSRWASSAIIRSPGRPASRITWWARLPQVEGPR